MAVDLAALVPVTRWHCRACNVTDVTREAAPHSRFHPCAGMGGLTMPMLREGEDAKVVAAVREDYVGGEDVQYDGSGRPVSAFVTEHADGHTDVAVCAPTAYASGGFHG